MDLTAWTFWWEFNKDPILGLRRHLAALHRRSGTDGWFLGHGAERFAALSRGLDPARIQQRIAPALRRALEAEKDNDVVTACLIALAKIGERAGEEGERPVRALLLATLPHPVQEVSETAAIALGILADPGACASLAALLADEPAGRALVGRGEVPVRTRAFAAYALGLIGARVQDEERRAEIVRALWRAVDGYAGSDRDVPVAGVIALGLVPALAINPPPGTPAGTAPPESGLTARIDALLALFADESADSLVRAHVPTAVCRLLARIPGEYPRREELRHQIGEALLSRLDRRERAPDEIVQSAVLALGLLGRAGEGDLDGRIRRALLAVPAACADQLTRRFALIALAQSGGRPGEGDAGESIHATARHLLDQLAHGSGEIRAWAGLAVGLFGAGLDRAEVLPGTVRDLGAALRLARAEEKSPERVAAIALGAGILGEAEAGSRLRELLDTTRDPEARGYVALALGLLGEGTAIAPIERVLEESRYAPELLRQAAIALGLLENQEVVPRLVRMLEATTALSSQAAIATALGFLGDQRSVDPLVALLENEEVTPLARAFAAVALGILADPEELSWNAKISVDLNYRASTVTLNDAAASTGVLNIL
ncbi:MAG: HEAT repeat domain-containing protein [Planctomycetota bacterium]